MCKIKYFLFLDKNNPQFFCGISSIYAVIYLRLVLMILNKTKKNLSPETKKNTKKSKLDLLTNENDFLVKNLRKAG